MACARVGVTMLEGSASGLRQIDSMGSILQVRAGPLSDVNRIKDMGRQFGCIAYAIDATRLYVEKLLRCRAEPELAEQDLQTFGAEAFATDVAFMVHVPDDLRAELEQSLRDATAGKVKIEVEGEPNGKAP